MQSAIRRHRPPPTGNRIDRADSLAGCLVVLLIWAGALFWAGCDSGLKPPPEPEAGAIEVVIEYIGAWPARSEVKDLRFVAMQFVPQDTADFLQLNRMAISDGLTRNVDADTVLIGEVEAGPYPYAGVAQQFAADLLAWRPVGLYMDEGGLILVDPGATTSVSLVVDFDNPPVFPPSPE